MLYDKEKKAGISIDLVPLINIVFLLLIFFLVAGTFSDIDNFAEIDDPKAVSGNKKEQGNLVISLTKDSKLYYNHLEVSKKHVMDLLEVEFKKNPQRSIVLRMDANIASVKLVNLIEEIAALGGKNISIVTQAP